MGTTEQLPGPVPARHRPATRPSARGGRKSGANKRLANGLVALSTAAVMAVYGVGYLHTAPAAASVAASGPTTTAVALVEPTATSPATATAAPTATATIAATATRPAAAVSTATATAATAATATAAGATTAYRDGTYTGTGTSRHGSIGVTVVISGGKIASAEITECGTRYPCSKIAALPGQVVARQSASVDFVSGSTDSSTAYKSAVTAALAKAK